MGHLYLQSVRKHIPMADLPPPLLQAVGCTVVEGTDRVKTFQVNGVHDLDPKDAADLVRDLETICSSEQNRDVFPRKNTAAKKRNMRLFFVENRLLARSGSISKPKKDWYTDPELALKAVRYLYREVLRKDPAKSPPDKNDFTTRGLKDMLEWAFGGDPELAVKSAGLVPEKFVFKVES